MHGGVQAREAYLAARLPPDGTPPAPELDQRSSLADARAGIVQAIIPDGGPEQEDWSPGEVQRKIEATEVSPGSYREPGSVGGPARRNRNDRAGLPEALRTGLELLSGISLHGVKVHYNSPGPPRLRALAYTQGRDIYVGRGQEKHLPHEAWHAVQQMQGRVKPTLQGRFVSINDNSSLEREADVMGNRALQVGRSKPGALDSEPGISPVDAPGGEHEDLDGQEMGGGTHSGYPFAPPGLLSRARESPGDGRQPVQLKIVLDGGEAVVFDNQDKYKLDKWDQIQEHMAGEWNGKGNAAVTGGHLYSGMKNKWAKAGDIDGEGKFVGSKDLASGIYFEKPIAYLPNVVAGGLWTFALRQNKVQSGDKESTFWPKDWTAEQLKDTLQNSYKTNKGNNIFASKQNTSYWYTWQTLGNNTLFPVRRYSKAETVKDV